MPKGQQNCNLNMEKKVDIRNPLTKGYFRVWNQLGTLLKKYYQEIQRQYNGSLFMQTKQA